MRLVQGDFTCPICQTGTCRVVIDDGLPAGDSDAGTLRATALRIAQKHGGWACDNKPCPYKFPLTGDLLRAIAKLSG